MSAVVTIQNPAQTYSPETINVEVPAGNGYTIDNEGRLVVLASSYGDPVAVFKQWHYLVITPNRGPDGRFVKRGT